MANSTVPASAIVNEPGTGLGADIRSYMEARFNRSFADVRIHNGSNASASAKALHSKAYTFGNHIVFGVGAYQPFSRPGQHLLAHELTHVLQQRAGVNALKRQTLNRSAPNIALANVNDPLEQEADRTADAVISGSALGYKARFSGTTQALVQRVPNPAPPPAPYLPGRPAHNHPAQGNWAAVQRNAAGICARGTRIFYTPLPIPVPPTDTRGRSECACAVNSPLGVLRLARDVQMRGMPLAQQHIDHYISGGGADFIEHSHLDDLLNRDSGARGAILSGMARADRGDVFIRQSDYEIQDFRYAFGGIDRVDFQIDRGSNTVDVWFKDRYDFHPAGFGHSHMGTGDSPPPGRPSNCAHLAAVEAKLSGAADYWMYGHATLPLTLFTTPASPTEDSESL